MWQEGQGSRLTVLGLKLPMFVYILQPAVWHLLDRRLAAAGVAYLQPMLSMCFTVPVATGFVRLKARLGVPPH